MALCLQENKHMKTLCRNIIFIACAAIFSITGYSAPVFADERPVSEEIQALEAPVQMDPDDAVLFELINAARRDPLGMAESIGLDREQVLKSLPELNEILINGLPELVFSDRLHRTANDHTADMLENNYYAYESIDGLTLDDRLNQAGYSASASGESLGLIFFNNFIAPEKAVFWMFENMLGDELTEDHSGIRTILNPDFQEMAAAVQGGSLQFGRFNANVYMAVCDFARPVEIYELQMNNLINQLRANPLPVVAEYGFDASPKEFPEYETLLIQGLPPLTYDPLLYRAAEELVVDMFENNHFSATTSDGRTLDDRVADTGYVPAWMEESRYRLSTCGESVSPAETVSRMFRYLVTRAFQADPDRRQSAMIAPEAEDCGIRIKAGQSAEMGGVCGDYIHIMVADFGTRSESEDSAKNTESDKTATGNGQLIGLVYEDTDGNGIYTAGEGLPDLAVTIDQGADSDFAQEIRTNAAGGYSLDLPAGDYRVTAAVDTVDTETIALFGQIRINENTRVWLSADVLPRVLDNDL